jgi:hypothetical protein
MPNPVFTSPNPSSGPRSQDRLVLDNLIRRELKVGDPNDAGQVAQALLERYRDDPRAQAIGQESRGLPFLQTVPTAPVVQMLTAAGGAEWKQAIEDIEHDLRSLTHDAILKDVTPEIRGWAQAIRTALQEGYNASRFALDPRNRDKGFAMRRQLNDYARQARLVGAHTPAMLTNFRKFAQSLDEAANLLIVIMGEALANVGFGGGRYVPQVAYSDLQTRRDAAIYALRNLVGSTQMAYGPEDWPRGLDAYRQLNQLLDAQGQSDLRSLLVETELARTMDELVQRSGDNTSDGLRAVGSTAQLGLERFRRFIAVTRSGVSPESPALYAFLEALQLFASAFDSAGGFRLMKIARPPILFYGLYGSSGLDDADRRLVDLVTRRGLIADAIDCMAGACCETDRGCLVLLDKVLYDMDRAIDLYGLGFENFGATERRASAYGFVIDQVRKATFGTTTGALCVAAKSPLANHLKKASGCLRPKLAVNGDDRDPGLFEARARIQDLSAQALSRLAGNPKMQAAERQKHTDEITAALDKVSDAALAQMSRPLIRVTKLTAIYASINRADEVLRKFNDFIDPDLELDGYIGLVEQELCLQRKMESNWGSMVHSLVANCSQIDQSLTRIQKALDEAVKVVIGRTCIDGAPIDLPPALETSFDSLVDSVERTGLGRPNRALRLQRRR